MTAFVRNLWYMAAWEEEVPDDGVLARKLLDEKWLLMRKKDGSYAMLRDRCPHRFVALSLGRREGDVVHCPYHGLAFDGSGECVHNPFGGETPPGAKVPTLPVVARHRALWFWPGDADKADPDLIPDFSFVDGAADNCGRFLFPVNYQLIADNLMDLSHAEFIHQDSFGANGGLLDYGTQKVTQGEDGSITNLWEIRGAVPPAFLLGSLPEGTRIDQDIDIRWHAPACMALRITMTNAADDREDIMPVMLNPHILTPETATSTHYFFTDGPGEGARAMTEMVFLGEDEPMVSSAQEGLGGQDFWDARPVILASDAAAIRARRRLMQLARAEAPDAD